MDGGQFDSITRSFAGLSTRRLLLGRGAALAGVLGALGVVDSASAARRGSTGASTSICAPNGAGGYTRTSVPTIALSVYLNNGYIISNCCANAECGASSSCMSAYCDLNAGACAVQSLDGYACERPGCIDGYCANGVCHDPEPDYPIESDYCKTCTWDACIDHWYCSLRPCSNFDYQCTDAYCDPAQEACIFEPINEGSACNTNGVNGICVGGYCTVA